MEPINHEEWIHQYLDGSLEETSHEALFQQLATNAQYRDELTAQVSLHRAAQEWSRQNEISPEVTRKLFGSLGFTPQSVENIAMPAALAASRSTAGNIFKFLLVAIGASLMTFGLLRSGMWPGEAPLSSGNLRAPSPGSGISNVIPSAAASVPVASVTAAMGSRIPSRSTSNKALLNLANRKPERLPEQSVRTKDVVEPKETFAAIEPLEPARAIPSKTSIPIGIRPERLHFADPPLDYSGFVASVSYEQSTIPADPSHPEFAATSTNDMNYQVGYRFDRFNEVGIGYAQHVYRHLSSTTTTISSYNPATGLTTLTPQTTWNASDDPISLPGLYYTFHANNLQFFDIEPFLTGFASKPSAGFLWRASAGIEWNPWDKLNAAISYSREQLNSGTYPAPQNSHNFFDFGFSYRLLP